jgi:hypothetical protein
MSCLGSTVKNTSGRRMTFGFLPPHGRTLDDAEEMSTFGDIRTIVSQTKRYEEAFQDAIDRGDLALIRTPNAILYDDETGESVMLESNDGAITGVDPCWTVSASVE